jgi:hypothetical protein
MTVAIGVHDALDNFMSIVMALCTGWNEGGLALWRLIIGKSTPIFAEGNRLTLFGPISSSQRK